MDKIEKEVLANKLAWVALVEELYHSGVLNKQNLKNRIDSDMWLDCKDELSVYSEHLQFLDIHSSKNTYESAFNQNDGNTNQGIINSPNSNISNSFNK